MGYLDYPGLQRYHGKVQDEIDELKDDLEQIEPGLSEDAKQALLACFEHVAWIDSSGTENYESLEAALYANEIQSLTATFTQGNRIFSESDMLSDLIPFLTVVGTYADQSQVVIADYTLSGFLTAGTATITVTYGRKSTTFNVNVSTVPSGYTAKSYVYSDGTPYMATNIAETSVANCWFRTKTKRNEIADRKGHIFSSGNFYTPYLFSGGTAGVQRVNANRFGSEIGTTGEFIQPSWVVDTEYVLEAFKDGNNVYLNNVYAGKCPVGSTLNSSNKFCLLGYFGTGSTTSTERFRFIGYFYYLKIFNSNNEKVHDFIPCINSSNVAGIYDLVTGTFYSPASGSGSLTAN